MTKSEIEDVLRNDGFSVLPVAEEQEIVVELAAGGDLVLEGKRARRTLETAGLSVSPRAIDIEAIFNVHDNTRRLHIAGF
jgi:hypothetical protein